MQGLCSILLRVENHLPDANNLHLRGLEQANELRIAIMTQRIIVLGLLTIALMFVYSCEVSQADDPFVAAAYRNEINKVKEMLQSGYDVNKQNPAGNTALMVASSHGYEELVQLL